MLFERLNIIDYSLLVMKLSWGDYYKDRKGAKINMVS